MTKYTRALCVAAAAVALATGSAQAAVVIDFGTGSAGEGGTVTIGANVTGSGIFIDTVTILGASVNNGVFDVNGAGVCASGGSGSCGILNFDQNLNTITIVGSIPALGIFAPVNLLAGDLSGGLNVLIDNGVVGAITASGLDTKAPELLTAIGLDPATEFAYFGFETAVNSSGQGSPYTAVSTDMTNTSIPEPGSMALLGSGLLAADAARRRVSKARKSNERLAS